MRWMTLALVGCGGRLPEVGSETASYPGPYDLVTVETDGGRIEVIPGEVEGVELEFLPNGSDGWSATEENGNLELLATCFGDETFAGCGGGLVLTVGAGQAVLAKTGAGELRFRAGLEGTLSGQTASGALFATGLGPAALELLTGTGAVEVSFTATPRAVSIETGSSDAAVEVPAGGYALDVDTNGAATVAEGITDDPEGPTLRVHSGTGDLAITSY